MVKINLLFSIFLLVFSKTLFAQKELSGRVLTSGEKEIVSQCIITSDKFSETYLTNPEGIFRIPYINETDTLTFYSLGFETVRIAVSDVRINSEILLKEFAVLSQKENSKKDQSDLFSYIKEATKKLRKKPVYKSKAYLEYSGYLDDKDLEVSRFYYNILVQGSKVLDFNLKAGRVAIAPNILGLINLSPCITLIRQSPVQNLKFLPSNPLQPFMEKDGLNYWKFEEGSKVTNSNSIHIIFTPKDPFDFTLFNGEIWIDTIAQEIIQLNLKSNNSGIHPFVGKPTDSISQVNIETNFYFSTTFKNESKLIFIDFKYAFDYITKMGAITNKNRIKTEGLVHLYDYDSVFYIPKIKSEEPYEDYLKAGMLPFDSTFWQNNNGRVLTQRQEEKISKIKESGLGYNYSLNKKESALQKSIFDKNNVVWNRDSYLDLDINEALDSIRAELSVYIFLDLNTYDSIISYNSMTILNKLDTRYNLPYSKQNLVFQNIYFDLCEIVRLNLEEKLKTLKNVDEMGRAYEAAMNDLESVTGKFKKETENAKHIDKLKKWNDLIFDRTGVDNFKTFGLNYKPKKNK